MIQFDHVSKQFGDRVAVDDLTLELRPGEVFAFLGPNGAGKTTTIKMAVGLLRPTTGRVRVCGLDVIEDRRAACRQVGYVPDLPFLYEKLTGREFLQFVAELHALSPAEQRRQIDRQVELFELGQFVDQLTESYSYGMKHRLALAAALLHQPPVLVLDEPMVGLDPRGVRLVKDLLCQRAAAGASIFLSTHLLSVAEEIADRVGIVDGGRLRFVGTHDELRQQLVGPHSTLEDLYLTLTTSDSPGAGPRAAAAGLSTGALPGHQPP
jgi:ABC-2 type transport system ATP-binding protein